MVSLTNKYQFYIASILIFLLVITREYHLAAWHSLPGATWAVFFIAGVYLKPKWILPLLLLLTWALDFSAFKWGSASDFCLSPAYAYLIPAYSSLWLAGYWYSKRYHFSLRTIPALLASVFIGALLCELISSGSFYVLSGYFSHPNLTEFFARELIYFPAYLFSLYFYTSVAALVHVLFEFSNVSFEKDTPHSQ